MKVTNHGRKESVSIIRFSGETNGKLERFYGVLEDKMIRRAQIATIPEYVHWHNTIKPHMSLNWENLETPLQAFHRKLPEDRKNLLQTIQDAK